MSVTTPRLLFLGKPSVEACRCLSAELDRSGLMSRLGSDLFTPANWHQSLSDRFPDQPHMVEQLRSAGRVVNARGVGFRMDRVESQAGPDGIHWAFKAAHTPEDFKNLLRNLGAAIAATTGRKSSMPTAHLTISYWAPEHLSRMVPIAPVDWVLDEIMLVRGGGHPYHYELIDSWSLGPSRPEITVEQSSLF